VPNQTDQLLDELRIWVDSHRTGRAPLLNSRTLTAALTYPDLDQAFSTLCQASNPPYPSLDTIGALLDDNVELYCVNGQHSYIGKVAVMQYLQQQFLTNQPNFQPIDHHVDYFDSGNRGSVHGKANWSDYDPLDPTGAHIDGTIVYKFDFVKKNGGWLATKLWGTADHLKHHF
jgi:hypothetical protein